VSRGVIAATAVLIVLTFSTAPSTAGWLDDGGQDEGQVRASNLLLYQVGRDPALDPDTLTEVFNQFNLEYARGDWRVGFRLEYFKPSLDDGFIPASFEEVTRKYVDWRGDGIHLRVGSGYTTLGRGLLFRAFELPGVVRDAVFPGTKYVDSRDLDGFILDVDQGPFRATLLAGEPVRYPDTPHGLTDFGLPRRQGHLTGGHAALRVHRGFEVGAGYLRTETIAADGLEELGSVDVTLRLAPLIPGMATRGADASVYVEYAGRSWRPFDDGLDTADDVPHALYTATELSYGRWGMSFETKDYRDFALGVNDPPNLVPEMRQHLLNRMSHFLLQSDERGHGFSVMGALPGDWILQADTAHAMNDINGLRHYRLYFLGLESPSAAATRGEIFYAEGRDDVESIADHWTVGGGLTRDLDDLHAGHVSLEYQKVSRDLFGEISRFENIFVSAGLSRAGVGSVSLVAEFSNDPAEKDDPLTFDAVETDPRRWLGAYATLTLDTNHEASVFAGHRRGGTACTSGTCYLVPDFEGVEMRISSRF
jgi:hypothetical protein